jgi:NADH-ubiquinone oxidoreductase chain 1
LFSLKYSWELKYKKFQTNIDKINAMIGDAMNINILTWLGINVSLVNNLIPSLKGWSNPYIPTILGPFLIWVYPNIFLSIKVNNATDINIGIINPSDFIIIMAGWSSNSKYGFLGSIRATSQMISYEISLGFILGNIIILSESFNLSKIYLQQYIYNSYIYSLLPVSFLFFISLLVEINRAPFDLTEGESELVSGYNIEYSSFIFALFFLAEYSHIIFSSMLFSLLFFSNKLLNTIFIGIIFIIIILIIRSSFPRFRYDKLMYLLWKTYLPLSIIFILINILLLLLC